jgi:hypothetical protein
VPIIPENIPDCAIYLYPSVIDAEDGNKAGGTGFLVGYVTEHKGFNHTTLYAVTNAHVIDSQIGSSPVVRLNTNSGSVEILPLEVGNWIAHPDGDDVAVCALKLSTSIHKFAYVTLPFFLGKDDMRGIDVGAECFLVGRFQSHDGKQKNQPSLRFGNVAQMNGEPIRNERTGVLQESFIVDVKSIGGYSGSPVFVMSNDIIVTEAHMKRAIYFLGVDWCHMTIPEFVRDPQTREPLPGKTYVNSNTGMAGVVPAWKVRELLECERVKMSRDDGIKKERDKAAESGAVLDSINDDLGAFTKADFENALTKASRKLSDKK